MKKHIYKNPEKYSQNNALQYNFAMKSLSKAIFKRDSRVLDIGCGDGIITAEIAKIAEDGCIIGTDISHEMIKFASSKYHHKNLKFIQMDAANNIFRHQFDIITSFNCLHWVKDQEKALSGIANAAIEGAQVILLLSHKKSTYHHVLDSICSSPKWSSFFENYENPRSFFSPESYKEMIINSGLSLVELNEEEMTYTFETKELLKQFFNSAGSQISQIPHEHREEFLDDFADRILSAITPEQSDLIPLSFWCLQIIAKKPLSSELELSTSYNPILFSKL